MKYTLLLLTLCVGVMTAPALAQSSGERTDVARCDAAFKARNDAATITWCNAEAQDHEDDAISDTGDSHAMDLVLEGLCLWQVGEAHQSLTDGEQHSYYDRSRLLLNEVLSLTSDTRIINMAQEVLTHMP